MSIIVIDTAKDVLDTKEAAAQLNIGYATLYRWIKDGKIIAMRLSGRTLIPISEVRRLKNEAEEVKN